jgi:hypothetical protein
LPVAVATPGAVAIEHKAPEPISDPTTTDSSAATLAMPLSKIGQSPLTAAAAASLQQVQQLGQGGTLLVKPGDGPAHRPNPNARPPETRPGEPGMQRHPSGYYLPVPSGQPTGAMAAQAQAVQAATPRQVAPVPRVVMDESTSAPGSGDKTRIYRPERPAAMLDSSASSNPLSTQDKKASAIPLVLGAIAFALVGFAFVAAVLYLRAH